MKTFDVPEFCEMRWLLKMILSQLLADLLSASYPYALIWPEILIGDLVLVENYTACV